MNAIRETAGEYKLDGESRIGKRHAKREHFRRALDHAREEYLETLERLRQLEKEWSLLEPYYDSHPGITMEQAVAMYTADHPEEMPY